MALVVALGVWVFNGDDGSDPPTARPVSAADRAKASASASASAAASRRAAATASAAARKAAAVAALPGTLDGIVGGAGDTWSVATLDLTTGKATNIGATAGMYTGSIIKVSLLENLIRVRGGVANLSAYEQSEATLMITQSDNDAANALWAAGGRDAALQQTLTLLGTANTVIGGGGYFGVTTTSAADQIKVLQQLMKPTFLTAADVGYIRGLMGEVVTDQRWGVPTGADPGTATENKNGWLNNDADNGRWLVNSLGIVTIGGDQYLVAALTQHQPDFTTGVQRLDAVVAAVAATLR